MISKGSLHFIVLCWMQGRIVYSNGDTFDGLFRDGQIEGEGTLKCANGVEYNGDWKHSQVSFFLFLSLSHSNFVTSPFPYLKTILFPHAATW